MLSGENAIVQLPTGVGKTKSIELIIRSSFLSNRTATAIIVAPLRALCNEIASDMISAFGESVLINQFSDILENDFIVDFTLKATILICTPEKLSYIIHHQVEFLDEIGLYIFDESHMFDDGRRGTAYELLISEIRKHINTEKQIVLLSAVLSNAEQIKQWLFNENGTLASDPAIKTTPKSIGFSSQTRDIHYYSEDPEREDFYVPRSIEVNLLKKLGKERKKRYFPKLTDSKDIAIYYANKLCKNGGAAIFANRTRSVQTIIQQIIDLDSREYDLSGIQKYSNTLEMSRIAKLMADYYGCDHPYTKACNLGVAPHYSNLPNGLRLAIEYAFRKKDLHLVICTSTLAQGVNIPIKYLFMTSFMLDQNSMKIRNFQNLMGRTARSGMCTEGSVIVTDSKLFDNKNNRRNGGFYKWENCVKMFDSHAAEPCESSILWLVQDIEINHDDHVKGVYGVYLINGAVEKECPQLRIIEPELFEQAQELRQARTCERGGTSLGTSSKALLTGLVYCGHCGNRLSLTSSGRTHTYADGHTVKEVRPRYSCFYKIRHPGDCDGQSGYGVSKLDSIVEEVVRQIFAQFREVSRKKLLESVKTNDAARIQKKVKKIQKDLESKQKELDDLKAETILVIRGVSALDKELLGTLVAEARETLETLEKQLVQAQEEYEEATKTAKRSNYICNELFTWADVYDTANHDERRAILQQFITEIRVRKDYEISITLNASFNQVEQLKAVSTYDGAEIFEEISEKGA